ncbi:hypothetical protein J5690_10325 [bacterium]|nr:hypothetical protein [bacterium]
MIKKTALFLFILCTFCISAESYLTNVATDPEHSNLNYEGSLKFYYDLPKPDLVKKAYLQTEIDGVTKTLDSTVTTGNFLSINNSLSLSGKELFNAVKSARTLENPDDKSTSDGKYSIIVRIELDTSKDDDDDDDDEESNDDDDDNNSRTSSVPEYAEKKLEITFDNKPPKAPAAIEIEGGNKKMIVKVTPPSAEDGKSTEKIGRYHAEVTGIFKSGDAEAQTTLKYTSSVKSGSYDKEWEFNISGKDGYEFINNDEGKSSKAYTVKVYAEDLAGNSDDSATISLQASAATTYGFWSNYQSNGGKDDGGFCFVATAGFGSYFHPSVALLREFRDSVLSKFNLGKRFIAAYYKYGSYPAGIIKDSPILRAASRTVLMPLVITAWFLTTLLGRIFMISWLISLAFLASKPGRKTLLTIFFALLLTVPFQDLSAKENKIHGEASFTNLLYYPNIDSEINGTPFKDVAGPQVRWLPSFTFGLAVPIPYIRLTFIGGIGYTRFKGRAMRSDGSKSGDRTTMHFIPLKAEIKLRPVYDFPLYPYIAGGLDYYTWWVRDGGKTTENGGTFGLHGTIGLMLSLNWMDPSSSKKMKENGVVNTFLFLGYKFEKINDFWRDKSFDLSNKMKNNFEFGLVFEF